MTIVQSLIAFSIIVPLGVLAIMSLRYAMWLSSVEQSQLIYMEALKSGDRKAAKIAGRAFYTVLNKGRFDAEQERLLKEDIG